MSEVKNYYADDKKQTFYQKYWGGESIHVGIYLNEFKVFAFDYCILNGVAYSKVKAIYGFYS
mgnify:CR=1 FL=1